MAIDLNDISERNVAVLVELAMLAFATTMPDEATARDLFRRMALSLSDLPYLRTEVDDLARIRAAVREKHCPENDGGQAFCRECSADGGRRLWPCVTWKLTER